MINIDEEKLKYFIQGCLKYKALKEGGVDNWQFYYDSLDNYLNTSEYVEDFDDAYNELAKSEIEKIKN